MSDVSMPRLSDSMEEGTILKWLKADGDEVKRGEELVEIETDKANMTYEADAAGILTIVAREGDTLAVGEVIARIGEGSATSGAGGDGAARAEEREAPAEPGDEPDTGTEQPKPETADVDGDEERAPEGTGDSGGEERELRTPGPDAEGGGHRRSPDPRGEEAGEANGNGRVKASPVARRIARETGVELSSLHGSGPGGRIVKGDVEAAATQSPSEEERPDSGAEAEAPSERGADQPQPETDDRRAGVPPAVVASAPAGGTAKGDVETQELSRLQQTIARRMAESKATAPDFVLTVEVDMEECVALRRQLAALQPDGHGPSYNDFVVKASALALRDFPRANGAYRDGRFELYSRVNVGIAVAGQDALVVPTLFDADRKSLGEIARDARALAERVRAGAITPPELAGGTFTVSNLGMYGIRRFTAVINPPQAAILSVGSIEPRPVVRDGEVTVAATVELTLACDHRILYGAEAAEFLGRIRERLEQPLLLAL